jgi:hypothetical protein|tara:strand:- start:292 stop:1536 length:1245 start_codon:yes stop_codon:yes gene_type:complete
MASTYSDLKIQLMGTGDNSGAWGGITNTNLGTALEEAIAETADVTFSKANISLTLSNANTTQTARHLRLNLVGESSAGNSLTLPDIEKSYIINNNLTADITIKTGTATPTIIIPAGRTNYVYANASAGMVDTITSLNTVESTQLVMTGDIKNDSGNLTVNPATQIFEIKGSGSTEGQIQLNCAVNTHGQKIQAQDHSLSVTNTMLLPKGADSTLVSEAGTATISFKTLDSVVSVSAAGAVLGNTTLDIHGAISGGSTLSVASKATFDGDVTVQQTLTVAGAISAHSSLNITGNISSNGTLTTTGIVSDGDGSLREVPRSRVTDASITLATTDIGNFVLTSSSGISLAVPTGTFDSGDILSIIAHSGSAQLSAAITGMIVAGAASATAIATIADNGVASLLFISDQTAIVTGNVS